MSEVENLTVATRCNLALRVALALIGAFAVWIPVSCSATPKSSAGQIIDRLLTWIGALGIGSLAVSYGALLALGASGLAMLTLIVFGWESSRRA